jgi:hypothetical protein
MLTGLLVLTKPLNDVTKYILTIGLIQQLVLTFVFQQRLIVAPGELVEVLRR